MKELSCDELLKVLGGDGETIPEEPIDPEDPDAALGGGLRRWRPPRPM